MVEPAHHPPHELFLSHASSDSEFTTRLATTLRRHAVPVWYSPTEIVPAQRWHDEIGIALERCDWFAVVVTESAIKSVWVRRELLYALNDPRYQNRVVPIIAQHCDVKSLSWTLPQIHYADFLNSYHGGCATLLRIWGIEYIPES